MAEDHPTLFKMTPPEKEKTRQEQIIEELEKFLRKNPHVWALFERFTFEAIHAGMTRFGAALLVNRIRWETSIETRSETVKINQNFTAYLARMFMLKHPEHDHLFRRRVCRSAERPAGEGGVVLDRRPDPGEEDEMLCRLLDVLGGNYLTS